MPNPKTTFANIKREIIKKQDALDKIHASRMAVGEHRTLPSPIYTRGVELTAPPAEHRTFKLLAQGDSWFDYPPGTDLIHCLHEKHGHTISNIAVAGSTLNDEAYGPVPRELFGLPNIGPRLSNDPSRIAELIHRICADRPDALLLSAGGNDVAGDAFFSFINNALSGLTSVNRKTLDGVVNTTFRTAYKFMIQRALEASEEAGIKMPIFLHGYDYPWPDGRGLLNFIGWRIGPWFDDTFNHKNYQNKSSGDLLRRHEIIKLFIDEINVMQQNLVMMPKFLNKVFHVDLRGTLLSRNDWANELHPNNDGFAMLAAKINYALQANI